MRLRNGGAYASELPKEALPHEVLVRICGLLPPGALAVTPGRVSRAWAAAKAEAWAAYAAAAAAAKAAAPPPPPADDTGRVYDHELAEWLDPADVTFHPFLPGWYVRGIYASAVRREKLIMMLGACFHGPVELVADLYTADPEMFASDGCNAAAGGGALAVLQFLRARGCPWDERVCINAAATGRLDVLAWAHVEAGCPWSAETSSAAVRRGNLHILEWMHEQDDCPFDASTCSNAADSGRLEILAWLRQHNCPWSENTCNVAAVAGNLPILAWARQNGAPWGETTCLCAAECGHLSVSQHLVQQGCPIDVEECLVGAWRHPACQEWLLTLLPAE